MTTETKKVDVDQDTTQAPKIKTPVPHSKTQDDAGPRVRIKIRAYDHKIIDSATKTIVETAERHNAKVVGPVPLPIEKNKFSVNRATFIHKTAQEQYEMRTHKRLIDIYGLSPKAIDALMNLNLPSGVDVEIKMG